MEASNMHTSVHRYLDLLNEDPTKDNTLLLEQRNTILDDLERLQKSVSTTFHVLHHISI